MLSEIGGKHNLTVEYLASILKEVHQEGKRINTLYSNVYDLKNGLVYLYYWHQFDYVVTLNVAEMMTRQPPPAKIKSLFPDEIVSQAAAEYEKYR